MNKNSNFRGLLIAMAALTFIPGILIADQGSVTSTSVSPVTNSTSRYGLFNGLDHRSAYGEGVFPEPFIIDDSDLESNEARLDWTHTETRGQRSDEILAEFEKGFGLLTLEIEVPYVIDRTTSPESTTQGFGNIDVGARYPFFQFVSENKFIDTTFGAALEVGIPTESSVSKDWEVVPKVFNDLRVGNHIVLQTIAGYSMIYGSDDDNNLHVFEYGLNLGYRIEHKQLPLPGILQLIPVFEMSGETNLNKDEPGHTSLTGGAGFRANCKTIGKVQPRLGIAYLFPLNENAREDLHWGVITSLVFEY